MATATISPTPELQDYEYDRECFSYDLELVTGKLSFCYSLRSGWDTGLFETWVEKESKDRFDVKQFDTRREAREFARRQCDAYAIYYQHLLMVTDA